jgi:hypothetical protein
MVYLYKALAPVPIGDLEVKAARLTTQSADSPEGCRLLGFYQFAGTLSDQVHSGENKALFSLFNLIDLIAIGKRSAGRGNGHQEAIDEFQIGPASRNRLLVQRR